MDDYWEPAKKQLLADAKGFMDSLVKFDKDNIPDRIIKKVKTIIWRSRLRRWWWSYFFHAQHCRVETWQQWHAC